MNKEQTKIIKITTNYIIFKVPSSRGGCHTVVFDRQNSQWSCECEDYFYRKRACKHTRDAKNLLNMLQLECATDNVYTGETITVSDEVHTPNKADGQEDLTVREELLNIKEELLAIREENTDSNSRVKKCLGFVNNLLSKKLRA